jgi:hypothetical protein
MKTYSLHEVAEQVLPTEWSDSVRWLARRLNRGEIRGYRVGRTWRMTETHVEDLIERFSNGHVQARVEEPLSVADGLSQRSRRRLRSA